VPLSTAADELGVTPARVRALVASGALPTGPDGGVAADALADLVRRGTVRSADLAAVEGALDRALRRRLPALLEETLLPALGAVRDEVAAGLGPLTDEVATAIADVEVTTRQLAEAQESVRSLRAQLSAERERSAALERRVASLSAALEQQPSGLFRRRRAVVPASV
jgi:hypothetical protein